MQITQRKTSQSRVDNQPTQLKYGVRFLRVLNVSDIGTETIMSAVKDVLLKLQLSLGVGDNAKIEPAT